MEERRTPMLLQKRRAPPLSQPPPRQPQGSLGGEQTGGELARGESSEVQGAPSVIPAADGAPSPKLDKIEEFQADGA
eukprot:9305417-Alexandrium_andersonii.AAC.1